MVIKIIKEHPEVIHLTRREHDRLKREWEASNRYTTDPKSFEDFVRDRKAAVDKIYEQGIAIGQEDITSKIQSVLQQEPR